MSKTPIIRVKDFPSLEKDESARLEKLEAWLLCQNVQAEYELSHSFSPQIYVREILMLKNTLLIGHEHKFEHFNVVLSGKALVLMEGKTQVIEGPCYFKSGAGVRKVLYILEDMRWMTIHPNEDEERNVDKLEERLINKSQTFLAFEKCKELEEFQSHMEQFKPRKEVFLT